MAKTRHSGVEHPSERGSALLGVLLMMMSALAAALAVNGHTETLISRNQRSAIQATVAAEAGLNHSVELATTYISQWKANGFANVEAAIDALLLGPDGESGAAATDWDNGSLGARTGITFLEELPKGTRLTITGGINAEYEAFVMDDDATAPDEPGGDLYDDENAALIVRSIGCSQDGTKVVLEALIAPIEQGAVVVNGDLVVGGNATIDGSEGRVHANGDLTLDLNADVTGAATAGGLVIETGGHTSTGPTIGGAPELSMPEVRASDYLAFSDFVLTSAGTMTEQAGTVLCAVGPLQQLGLRRRCVEHRHAGADERHLLRRRRGRHHGKSRQRHGPPADHDHRGGLDRHQRQSHLQAGHPQYPLRHRRRP